MRPELTAGARPGARVRTRHSPLRDGGPDRSDWLVTEEPLEVRVRAAGARVTAAVTMRTPGDDFELALGFLHGEGIIASRDDVSAVRYCVDRELSEEQRFNVVSVDLARPPRAEVRRLDRSVTGTSACGVCGKERLDQLERRGLRPVVDDTRVRAEVLTALPDRLRDGQDVFDRTGGLHAAALFTASGELVAVREDVGRHNALDKLVGWALLEDRLPLDGQVVLLSGRASYELVQKAVAAGAPIVTAISAPSSLAVDLARRFDLTLVGFLRDGSGNVYTREDRIVRGAP